MVELGSDQTSCHNPFNGGYYPVGLSFDEANEVSFQKLLEVVLHFRQKTVIQQQSLLHASSIAS